MDIRWERKAQRENCLVWFVISDKALDEDITDSLLFLDGVG
jgi:hypothetical protein